MKIFIILAAFFFTNITLSQDFSPEEKEILLMQDSRTLGENDKLLTYLNSDNTDIVSRALFALANIQDSSTVDEIGMVLLTNPSVSVRIMAAFAIGQISCEPSRVFLRTALKSETDMYVNEQLLEALGKIGDTDDLKLVPSNVSSIDYNQYYSALSILRFGLRKIKDADSFQTLANILNSNPGKLAKQMCLYTFWRTGDSTLLTPHKELLLKYLKDESAECRSFAIAALGKLKDVNIFEMLFDNMNNETDWRCRVNTINIINNFSFAQLKNYQIKINDGLMDLLREKSNSDDFKISYLAAYLGAVNKLYSGQNFTMKENEHQYNILMTITIPFKKEQSAQENYIAGESIKTLGNIYKEDVKEILIDMFKKSDDYDEKAAIISAFSGFNDGKIYKEVRDLISNDVQMYSQTHEVDREKYIGAPELAKLYRAYSELIGACLPKVSDEDKNIIRLICYDFLTSKDVVMVANCLEILKDSTLQKPQWLSETKQVVAFEYPNLSLPQDFDLITQYIDFAGAMKIDTMKSWLENNLSSDQYEITKKSTDALQKITGNDYSEKIKNKIYNKDFDWDYLKKIYNIKFADIKTTKGNIKIELFPEVTPFTVYNFVKLSEKGFYNNTLFHRVVPNFVIQGGDVAGTGFGGPGYSIRSELSQFNYFTGALGMASSGKDTEGCQFFITHSPQFHLDAKYTLFGIVKEGQEVADNIHVGDRVESITFIQK